MTAKESSSRDASKKELLPDVKNIIPVASGKGGVGKSTVSVNLALALNQTGANVGILDADIYGPSIPLLLDVNSLPKQKEKTLLPVNKYNMKVMSMGFFLSDHEAVIWRGPMLSKMLDQFLRGVEWGVLDYLIIDLPPGTGDVQLSLCQTIPITGAVIVTTPQDVALNVARKAILMFNQLKSPILGVIENMSYYICSKCGERADIFGVGGGLKVSKEFGIPFLGDIPLTSAIRETSDIGKPVIISDPQSPETKAFTKTAENLAAQVSTQNLKSKEGEIKVTF